MCEYHFFTVYISNSTCSAPNGSGRAYRSKIKTITDIPATPLSVELLSLSHEIVIEVLKLACYMQFTKVITMCSRFLVGLFDKDLVTYEDAFLIVMLAHSKKNSNG